MKRFNLPNVTLIALVACYFLQCGAQLFALSVVASTVAEAPPRSFAMLTGPYGYDSRTFWDTMPNITFILFVIALLANWKNQRRKQIAFALCLFIIAGLAAVFFLEPVFAEMMKTGYSDEVDPTLKRKAGTWYFIDWMVWVVGFIAGFFLLFALANPIKSHSFKTFVKEN